MSRNEAKLKAKRRHKGKLNLKLKIYIFLMVLSYESHGCADSRLEHGEHDLRPYAAEDQGSGQDDRSMEGWTKRLGIAEISTNNGRGCSDTHIN